MSSVSVVIPCYNYGHFLRDAVDGALDQPGVDVKVLIIDDASTLTIALKWRKRSRQTMSELK